MKILHVAPYFAPAWAYGGTPKAVYELARHQARQGHQVVVVTTDALTKSDRARPLQENIEGISVIRVPNLSQLMVWRLHFVTPVSWPKQVSLTQFDVIHLHETRTLLNLMVLLQSTTSQIIFSPWGTFPHNQQLSWPKRLFDVILLPLLKKKVTTATGQTAHEAALMKEAGVGRHQVIVPLGVEAPTRKQLKLTSYRKELGLSRDHLMLLFLGRFAAGKGLQVLFEAFSNAVKDHPKAVLVCVGRDDGYLSTMQHLVSRYGLDKQILIQDPLYGDDRWQAYTSADLFVFTPTVYEETSTACLEALLSGVPVMTTYQAEVPFLSPKDGVIHTQAEVRQVSRTLDKLIRNLDSVKVNTRLVEKHFLWPAVITQLEKVYAKKI